jgi:hypothetical protein
MNINLQQIIMNRRRPGLQFPILELAQIKVVPYIVDVNDEMEAAAIEATYSHMYEQRFAYIERD